jgi:RNA polymerase sigma-70 factor (ECF subfamily)
MSPQANAVDPLRRPTCEPVDDHTVISRSLTNADEFGQLYQSHAREMHPFLSRRLGDLADDLFGELFVTAFERRSSYQARLTDARPCLYGIAANLVRRHDRAEATRYRALARIPFAFVSPDDSPAVVATADTAAIRPSGHLVAGMGPT